MQVLQLVVLLAVTLCLVVPVSAQPLTAQQRAEVRQVRNLVIDCETHAGRLEHHLAQIEVSGTQTSEKTIQDFNASAKQLEESFLKAKEAFATLPSDDETVAELLNRANATLVVYQTSLARAEEVMNAAAGAVQAAGGQEGIAADMERVRAIAGQFSSFGALMNEEPATALAMLMEFQPAVQEIKAFEVKYADFLKSGNADAAPVQRQLEEAKNTLRRTNSDARDKVAEVRQTATNFLDEAERMITTAVEERKPAFFGKNGGVPHNLEQAKQRLALAHVIDAEATKPLAARWQQVDQKAKQAAETLEQEIITANPGPEDRYRGADREELLAAAKGAWAHEHPEDEIVKVTLPPADWKRETKWTWWRDAFYFTDRSDLQAAVVIKAANAEGEPEMHAYPVDITKDHQNNDVLKFTPWEKQPVAEMPIHFRFLPDKV